MALFKNIFKNLKRLMKNPKLIFNYIKMSDSADCRQSTQPPSPLQSPVSAVWTQGLCSGLIIETSCKAPKKGKKSELLTFVL